MGHAKCVGELPKLLHKLWDTAALLGHSSRAEPPWIHEHANAVRKAVEVFLGRANAFFDSILEYRIQMRALSKSAVQAGIASNLAEHGAVMFFSPCRFASEVSLI